GSGVKRFLENYFGIPPNGGDWLNSTGASFLAWWLPKLAIFLTIFVAISFRTLVWLIALLWMGTACILNARRCGRTHCRYTGHYLAMILPVLALAFGRLSAILGRTCSVDTDWWVGNSVGHRIEMGPLLKRLMSAFGPKRRLVCAALV